MIQGQESGNALGQGELNWAEQEFVDAHLGDKRLEKRMIEIAKAFMEHPEAQIPQAMGNWARTKAAYRFFDQPKVTMEKILEPHRKATSQRLKGQRVALAIQDTSFIDYTDHPATEGLGLLSDENHQGLIVHPTLAVSEEGVPLGLIDMQILDRKTIGVKSQRKSKGTEEKESRKWLESYRATVRFGQCLSGQTHLVNVGDREGDIYDFFAEVLHCKDLNPVAPDVLVRAARDRRVEHETSYLWAFMRSREVAGTSVIEVRRKDKLPTRQAHLSIRYAEVTIKPPTARSAKEKGLKPLVIWAVYAHEEHPPKGVEAISWMLLTSMAVGNFREALEKVLWYTLRWTIEIYFRVLKSGCRIEERQLEAAHRLKGCLAMDRIIAWRILFLTKVGRGLPELPATILFEDHEWKALCCFISKTPQPPSEAPSLGEMIRQIGKLGGFLGRQSDGHPGSTCLWRGMWRLTDITATWKIFNKPSQAKDMGNA